EVECVGEPGDLGLKSIAASAVAGFLSTFIKAPMNAVSAPLVAADRGITVRELRSVEPRGKYRAAITISATGENGARHVVEGTVGGDGTARLVKWNAFDVEAQLGGVTLVVTNKDKPGVLGFIGTTLGNAGVNVARVH